MKPQANSYLNAIANYVPGKSKAKNHGKIIKLSSNENALGASPKAIEAYKNHADLLFRYADGSCEALRQALAKRNEIEAERIVCGAGSDEIISFLTSAFAGIGDEIIYSEYGFLMYPISAQRVGANPIAVPEQNLRADVKAIIAAITKKTKIIFIANPNNPTGSYLTKNEVEFLIAKTPKNILIVLDSAYEEFVEMDDYPCSIDLVRRNANVVLTRTFSKIYGLPSLRLGWSYSSLEIAEILNKIRGPFNVGGPAQIAGLAALKDEDFLQKSKAHNSKWLKIFAERFSGNNASNSSSQSVFKILPSVANFVLIDFFSEEKCQQVNDFLLENGVILREMKAYKLPTCLRATIGTDEENERVIELLETKLI